jgi:hypothetical protein
VTVSVSTQQDTVPPSTPVLQSAIARSSGQVDLTWLPSTDNVGVTGYQVLRNGVVIASVSGTSYSDSSVAPNTTYTFAVKAKDGAGNLSGASNPISVTTPALPSSGNCPGPASGAFTGCYYNTLDMTGTPVLVRTDGQINFDWGTGSPAVSVTPNNFSARWQGSFSFAQGTYAFTAMSSDGMRIYIDGNPILDRWRDQAATTYVVRQTVSAGTHLITVEYYERTGWPTAHLTWQPAP